MVDVILVATILVFFLLAALLVRALDRMIDASGGDADLDADPNADLDTGPDDVMRGLRSAPAAATASIAGFHLFPFGGLRKAGEWSRNYHREALRQMEQALPASGAQNP